MVLDHEQCYRAVSSRDSRFDGYFVGAVRTTGIYCRPSCPAVTPKRTNIEFFPTAAAAHEHGYRACKRCRPDASPGSPEWDVRGDVVARAMRLIADGVVDREGVVGPRQAAALQRPPPQPRRSPTSSAPGRSRSPGPSGRRRHASSSRRRRCRSRRSPSPPGFAASVSSTTPCRRCSLPRRRSCGRRSQGRKPAGQSANTPGAVTVDLAVRQPFDLGDDDGVSRGAGDPRDRALRRDDVPPVARPAERSRRRGDRPANPSSSRAGRTCASTLQPRRLARPRPGRQAHAPAARPRLRSRGDRRRPRRRSGARTARRRSPRAACARQRRSVRDGRSCRRRPAGVRLAAPAPSSAVSSAPRAPLTLADDHLTHVFPSPAELAAIDPALLPMPMRRRATLIDLANRIALGKIALDAGADRDDVPPGLARRPGHRTMDRRLRADARARRSRRLPAADLGVRQALVRLGTTARRRRTVAAVALVRRAPPVELVVHVDPNPPRQGVNVIHRTTIDSPIGTITLVADDDALVEVHLPDEKSSSSTVAEDATPGGAQRCWARRPSELESTSPVNGSSSTSRSPRMERRSSSPRGRRCARSPTARRSATASRPAASATATSPAPSAPPTGATRCRSSCRAIASSAPTVTSPGSAAASSARPGCSTTNDPSANVLTPARCCDESSCAR